MTCPICGGTEFARRVRTARLTVLRCRRCDLHLVPWRTSGQGGDYHGDFDRDAYVDYYGPFRRRVFRENWRRITALRPGGLALDIGASFGWFLDTAPNGWRVRGYEPSDDVAAEGRARGLEIVTGGIDRLADDPDRYDLITLWNVFEHLPDPNAALAAIRDHLRPGGLLAMCVPNRSGLFNRLAYRAHAESFGRVSGPLHTLFQVGSPAPHLYHYRESDLRRLLEAHRFTVLDVVGQPIVDLRRIHLRARLEPSGNARLAGPIGIAGMASVALAGWLIRWPDEIAVHARAPVL